MTQEQHHAATLDEVMALALAKTPSASLLLITPFLQQYYAQMHGDDLAERSPQDLAGAALAHLELAQERESGQALVHVYQPQPQDDGWHSPYAVAQIINDDMPFLVDSVTMEINRRGLKLHLIVHPQMRVKRDAGGRLLAVLPRDDRDPQALLESLIHVEMDRSDETDAYAEIEQGLLDILQDVRRAVQDWKAIQSGVRNVLQQAAQGHLSVEEAQESRDFLIWLLENHFTLLGARDYDLQEQEGRYALAPVMGTGLGILRDFPGEDVAPKEVPTQVKSILENGELLLLTKANARATVHRPGYLDYIGIKRFDAQGKVIGEHRLLGLYTSNVYSISPLEIPIVRRKVKQVLAQANFLPKSHMEKTLLSIIESYPRDELFEITAQELFEITLGILRLQERQTTRLFVRRDMFGRFVSCFVFVPREKYNTEIRLRIQNVLMDAFHGISCDFQPLLSESVLARIHFTIRTVPGTHVALDMQQLQNRVVQATRRWQDDLADALAVRFDAAQGGTLNRRYGSAFPAGYVENYPVAAAVQDIEMFEQLSEAAPLGMYLYQAESGEKAGLRFKLYQKHASITLSESLPMLECLGVRVLDERPYKVQLVDGTQLWMHDIGLEPGAGAEIEFEQIRPLFQELFACVWRGAVENDNFNRLALTAQLHWRQIVILRAYAKYFKQIGLPYSQAYIEDTLTAYPKLARKLVHLFAARFDPALTLSRDLTIDTLGSEIRTGLDQVSNLDQDKILRQYFETINATWRTNFYQRDSAGQPKSWVSFKFNPVQIPALPEPKPMFEIFVYSPRVEGVHLRGGKVARGGLRWSDRREDFRTEILGLVKAQMVKNTVIVPVGSKGGFYVKNPPPASNREAFMQEGIECYKTFLRGLLDLTDNLAGDQVVPPPDVVRHDPDDTYLVVAADKGTATFSDIANSVSQEYGFWLGDAFASGGGNGYDHKKMGITARGAWESVKRHFRELGHDTQTQDFTVAGVGDMSGDVFGNGMLLSEQIRLVAAFDHRHVFLDPAPDSAASFHERQRLFVLPRSSWDDYDKNLISAGGGVYPLSLKSIPISPQMKAVLGVAVDQMTPNELKSAILKAPVDLLYNGGIGTYFKASFESHPQVGDRANDAIRIDGREIRARVVAEGGNLGCTQNGRIEAAQCGVRLNTDAIDNSAGVDCSDHEVNIKILVNVMVARGTMTMPQRNELLSAMTEEVGLLVLQDNYYQTQCLSLLTRRGDQLLEGQGRLMRTLEAARRLNRKIEFLPSDEQLNERKNARKGLTAPENAVIMAYTKMWLFDELVASDVPDDSFFEPALLSYFPRPLQSRFAAAIASHPLRREIIATVVVNQLVNRVGNTLVHRVQEETGASVADVVRAYVLVRETCGLQALWVQIDALDTQVPDAVQGRMLTDLTRFTQRAVLWFLRHRQQESLADVIRLYAPRIAQLRQQIPALLARPENAASAALAQQWIDERVPNELAHIIASLELMLPSLDLIELSMEGQYDLDLAAQVYFALDQLLSHDWLRQQIIALPTGSHWQALARASLRDDLAWRQRTLTVSILKGATPGAAVEDLLAQWQQQHPQQMQRAQRVLADLQALGQADLAMLSVALRELRNLL